MIGNLITNDLLSRRMRDGSISIQPFQRELAQLAHYPLTLGTILRRNGKAWSVAHDFAKDGDTCRLQANEYVVVEIMQQVRLQNGFVGTFIPASNLIEQGLGLVAGKITAPFGQNGEKIRFGLKNYVDQPNDITKGQGLAYVQFFDLSGLPASEYVLSRRDLDVYSQRRHQRADDDSAYSVADDSPNF